jgi:hypothetical protein
VLKKSKMPHQQDSRKMTWSPTLVGDALSEYVGGPLNEFPQVEAVPVPVGKSNPVIFVMQSAEDWAAKNTPCLLYGAR